MRRSRSLRALRHVTLVSLLLAGGVACGSRTGLFTDEFAASGDGGPGGGSGIGTADGGRDALSDAPPLLDVRPPVDVNRNDCPDAEALLVYTITQSYELQSFNPDTGQFRTISSKISCPVDDPNDLTNTPFSMAVDRKGLAYVLFRDEHLYQVSTRTGACIRTAYVPRQSNFALFGMGFATNSVGPTEALFVAGDNDQPVGRLGSPGLARITPGTFNLTFVEEFTGVDRAELTGTGDGRLYAFYNKNRAGSPGPPSYIGEIDTKTAKVIGERRFDTVDQGDGWAFAFWGGDFFMFHAPTGGGSVVTRWRPADDTVAQVATSSAKIVGAGVSTCSPQE